MWVSESTYPETNVENKEKVKEATEAVWRLENHEDREKMSSKIMEDKPYMLVLKPPSTNLTTGGAGREIRTCSG